MADLTAHHSPIAQHTHLWLDGFLTAIRSVKPQWEAVWTVEFNKQARAGTLTYLQVANDFRDELSKDQSEKPKRPKKGSFVKASETPKTGDKRKQGDRSAQPRSTNKRRKTDQPTKLFSCLYKRKGCDMSKY